MQLAGLGAMECEWRDRSAQEEGQSGAAQGCSFLLAAEAAGRRGMQGAAIGGLGLLHSFVRDTQLILQHFSVHIHTSMITETGRQAGRAILVHGGAGQGVGSLDLSSHPPPPTNPTHPT